jgi:hypothetical protein
MSNPNPINFVASTEAKLKNICKQQNIDYRFALICRKNNLSQLPEIYSRIQVK